jgi:DNA polymerase III delta prime subunit
VWEGSDFCPLTTLFNGRDFPELHRSDDHGIPAVLYVLREQIKRVGLGTDTHEILVIVGAACGTNI